MPDKVKAKKLAAAKKKLKEYQSKEKYVDVDSSDTSEYGAGGNPRRQERQQQQQPNKHENVTLASSHTQSSYQQEQLIEEINNPKTTNDDKTMPITFTFTEQETISKSTNDSISNNDVVKQQKQHQQQEKQPHSENKIASDLISDYFKINSNDNHKSNTEIDLVMNSDIIETKTVQDLTRLSPEKTHINAMEILIAEKASLTAELTKQQTLYKEKLLETEELMVQLQMYSNRNKMLEDEIKETNTQNQNLKQALDDINKRYNNEREEISKEKLKYDEIKEHLEELKRELNEENKRNEKLEKELKEKLCELELSQIRINQISDEASLATDNRVEVLTQTKFIYEQQIRDLQTMVQQLTTERDQANQQYQNYVQHLNKEMTSISEKNAELIAENERLCSRERTLIEHIGNLEKQIQDNIAKQENLKEKINQSNIENLQSDAEQSEKNTEISTLKDENIKLQNENEIKDNKILEITENLIKKDNQIKELEEKIENILSERPDNEKLLATMESDKIAASRALIQNEELKKQLDEVQQKLIKVTNDKVELVNLLDSEQYTNRKIRENYEEIERELKEIKDKLHFKDEEMIRLTHENNELNKTILKLNQRIDRLMHYEAEAYARHKAEIERINEIEEKLKKENIEGYKNEIKNNQDCHIDHRDNDHDHRQDHDHDHNHNHNHSNKESCEIGQEIQENLNDSESNTISKTTSNDDLIKSKKSIHCDDYDSNIINGIPTHEAMEKLQERFRKLMLEVADLTDEKQRLEHLVGQLQGETETIGEYIALYQTQRRLLKQREIEKTTQLRMLLTEREEMKEKISNLTKLVETLIIGGEEKQQNEQNKISIDNNSDKELTINNEHKINSINDLNSINVTTSSNINNDNNIPCSIPNHKYLNLKYEKNPILKKIYNIIAEIKEKEDNLETNLKFVPSVDHCACCSGKFETI